MAKTRNNKQLFIAIGLILVVVAASSLLFLRTRKSTTPTPTTNDTSSDIKYAPTTEQEKKETEAYKDQIIEDQKKATTPPASPQGSGKKQVNPIITSADSNEVRAYVTGVMEEGGTCTATFKQDGKSFTATSAGFTNVSYTQCAPIKANRASFSSNGTWSVTLQYTSPTSEGISDTKTFTVQ